MWNARTSSKSVRPWREVNATERGFVDVDAPGRTGARAALPLPDRGWAQSCSGNKRNEGTLVAPSFRLPPTQSLSRWCRQVSFLANWKIGYQATQRNGKGSSRSRELPFPLGVTG
jgi:hypothetical protein